MPAASRGQTTWFFERPLALAEHPGTGKNAMMAADSAPFPQTPGWSHTRRPAPRRRRRAGRWRSPAVAALTLLGLSIRIANFDQSLFSDEISTYFVVNGPHWRS